MKLFHLSDSAPAALKEADFNAARSDFRALMKYRP